MFCYFLLVALQRYYRLLSHYQFLHYLHPFGLLKTGNQVFMKQERENKLSTTFNPKPLTVLDKQGNSLLLESDQGVTYKRRMYYQIRVYTLCIHIAV
jgi:hypothetical protein